MTYTVRQAASILGVAYSTVTLHCRKLGLQKLGPAWLIDDKALAQLRDTVHKARGNPNWRKHDA